MKHTDQAPTGGVFGARRQRGVVSGAALTQDTDLGNRRLIGLIAISVLAVLALLTGALPRLAEQARPGSPLLQGAAILGSGLLLMSMAAALAKRFGRPGRRGFRAHVLMACAGLVLVSAHTTGNLDGPPALLLLTLLALVVLGVWARVPGARHMAATFGTKTAALSPVSAATRARLQTLIARKRALLDRLQPGADEGLFSLTPSHWLRRPGLALAYQRLVTEERRLLGARASVRGAQGWWRLVHQLLAAGFVAGLVVHVIVVTFFAAYVAEGRDIYWWHLAKWSF